MLKLSYDLKHGSELVEGPRMNRPVELSRQRANSHRGLTKMDPTNHNFIHQANKQTSIMRPMTSNTSAYSKHSRVGRQGR